MTTTNRSNKGAAKIQTLKVYPIEVNRPTAGDALAAHTFAVLTLFGMNGKTKVWRPLQSLNRVWGSVVILHHGKKGRFQKNENRVSLTEIGQAEFLNRRKFVYDKPEVKEQIAAYLAALKTGKADGKHVKASQIGKPVELEI